MEPEVTTSWRSRPKRYGYALEAVTEATALRHIEANRADVSVVVVSAPSCAIIERIRHLDPDLPILSLTDRLPSDMSPEALHKQIDSILKPTTLARPAEEPINRNRAFIGNSPAMLAIDSVLPQIAASDVPVLVQGETGSGKEVLARELHANSPRADRPFIKLNCAALPSELVESELFGYERGAFTGAFQRKAGIFETANRGTLLLDEIGDMDVRLQAKLLQVLQDHSFNRIGGKDLIEVDVRVIAATHRDLEGSIEDGSFREDLFYRLNVVSLVVPPLRDRKDDLFELADFLLRKHAPADTEPPALTAELRSAMAEWHWPGNVRELENFVRRLLIFRDCAYLARELRDRVGSRPPAVTPCVGRRQPIPPAAPPAEPPPTRIRALEAVDEANRRAEADAIVAALNATRWNRREAALMLKIDYKGLLYKIKKLGIDRRPTAIASESAGTPADRAQSVATALAC